MLLIPFVNNLVQPLAKIIQKHKKRCLKQAITTTVIVFLLIFSNEAYYKNKKRITAKKICKLWNPEFLLSVWWSFQGFKILQIKIFLLWLCTLYDLSGPPKKKKKNEVISNQSKVSWAIRKCSTNFSGCSGIWSCWSIISGDYSICWCSLYCSCTAWLALFASLRSSSRTSVLDGRSSGLRLCSAAILLRGNSSRSSGFALILCGPILHGSYFTLKLHLRSSDDPISPFVCLSDTLLHHNCYSEFSQVWQKE